MFKKKILHSITIIVAMARGPVEFCDHCFCYRSMSLSEAVKMYVLTLRRDHLREEQFVCLATN